MDDARLVERERSSQLLGYRDIARSGRGVDLEPGLFASVVPATPSASIPNSVLYERPESVVERWDDLCELYAAAGVRAWTVWVRPGDDGLAAELLARRHTLDGSPGLMAAELDEFDLAPQLELELDHSLSWPAMAEINDAAYGLPPGTLGAALVRMPPRRSTAAARGSSGRSARGVSGLARQRRRGLHGADGCHASACARAGPGRGADPRGAAPRPRRGLHDGEPRGVRPGRAALCPPRVPVARTAADARTPRACAVVRAVCGTRPAGVQRRCRARRTRRYGGRPRCRNPAARCARSSASTTSAPVRRRRWPAPSRGATSWS